MQRLGCDYGTLKQINPGLVFCSLSGWGADGPYAHLGGHDLNYVAAAGILGAMETPQVLGGQIADIGGAYIGVSGILAALFRRERTGSGGYVDTSLSESALPFALYNWVEAGVLGVPGGGGGLTGGLACYRVYHTQDGRAVSLGALEEKFWVNFCNAIERPDLIEHHQQIDKQAYLKTELSGIFETKTAEEWHALLADADCCFMIVRKPSEAHTDPHHSEREMLGYFEDGTPWMRSPVRISESEPSIENIVPGYGTDTTAILTEAGYSVDEITQFKEDGIIR